MDAVHHDLRIRETRFFKFMASPGIARPMVPVHNDIVDGKTSFAEPLKSRKYFTLSAVAVAALPVSHSPARHHRSLAGQMAIGPYDLVRIITCYKIPVKLRRNFAIPNLFPFFFIGKRTPGAEPAERCRTIRLPADVYVHRPVFLQIELESADIGNENRAP